MEIIIPFLIPFIFVGFFALAIFIISRLGWHQYTSRYGTNQDIDGNSISYTSARFGLMNYNSILFVKYNEEGIYFQPQLFFKIFHQALFIPWEDITHKGNDSFFIVSYAKLEIGNPAIGTIKLKLSAFKKFQQFIIKQD